MPNLSQDNAPSNDRDNPRGFNASTLRIINFLGGDIRSGMCRCPMHEDRTPSLHVEDGEHQPTVLNCFGGGRRHNQEIVDHLRAHGVWGGISSKKLDEGEKKSRSPEERSAYAKKIWTEVRFNDGEELAHLLKDYLKPRGIKQVPETAMFSLAWTVRAGATSSDEPAMVLPVRNARGKLYGTHVTWLTGNLKSKRKNEPQRQTYGVLKGNFVELCRIDFHNDEPIPKLLIGEGVETTLSPMQLTDLPGIAASGDPSEVNPPEAAEYIILVDNDINPPVMLARRLFKTGAKVRLAKPAKPESGKKGYDWNDAHIDAGKDEVKLLELRRAVLKAPLFDPANNPEQRILDPKAPLECAREFEKSCGEMKLVFHRGVFYEWHGSHYRECDDNHLRSKLYSFLEKSFVEQRKKLEPFNPTAHKVNQIIDALKAGVGQNSRQEVPFWLDDDDEHPDANDLIACRNGLLDITSHELLPHTPSLFNLNSLPFDYDAEAPVYPAQWMEFLRQLWPGADGKQERQCLQEIFGLSLTTITKMQKMFLLLGPKRSGKGTIARVLTALLGADNVVNPTIASLSADFGLSPLIGKRVAIIADARLGEKTNAYAVVERLLNLSGEDDMTVNRKNREYWTGRLNVRVMMLSNELPRVPDNSGAFASRFVLLKLENTFIGREDAELTEKLLTELPGILNWSLRGLERLLARGHFEMPEASQQAIRQFEDLTSPVGAFVRDWCRIGANQQVNVKYLYKMWTVWCEEQGQRPGSNIVLGRNLRAVVPQLQVSGRGAGRVYSGLGLNRDAEEEEGAPA
jgi:putative DNA primase/helicase